MSENEIIVLKAMCLGLAEKWLDRAEFDYHLMDKKRCADYELRLGYTWLGYAKTDHSKQTKLRIAKKLSEKFPLSMHQWKKGSAWSFHVTDMSFMQEIYDNAFSVASNFEITKGAGFIPLPQLTKTKSGKNEMVILGDFIFNRLMDLK